VRLLRVWLRGMAIVYAPEALCIRSVEQVGVVPGSADQEWPLGQGQCLRLTSCGLLSVGPHAGAPDVGTR
jgi:hypothetical protein